MNGVRTLYWLAPQPGAHIFCPAYYLTEESAQRDCGPNQRVARITLRTR